MTRPNVTNVSPLSTNPVKLSSMPTDDALLEAAEALLESTSSWKEGKSYGHVRTFFRRRELAVKGSMVWHCRLSEYTEADIPFDLLWENLSERQAEVYTKLSPNVFKVTRIKYISADRSVWSIYCNYPSPISPRVFTVLVIKRLDLSGDSALRRGLIVSIPVDISSRDVDQDLTQFEERGVRGRYIRIERVAEVSGSKVEWRMATSGTAGGQLLRCWVDRKMPGEIAAEVPRFIEWLRTLSKQEDEDRVHSEHDRAGGARVSDE